MRRKLNDALDYGRQLQSVLDLQPISSDASPDDVLSVLDVSELVADAQPKKITIGDLVTAAGSDVAGSDGEIQYNDNGQLGATSDFKWDDVNKELDINGDINLDDGGTYQTVLQSVTPTADRTITFPDATGIVALIGGSSGQLIYNNAGAYAGTQATYNDSAGFRFILPFGYGTGAGGTQTQLTNKATTVELNTRCGQITLNNATLNADTTVTFTFTNSQIAATDLLVLNHVSGGTAGAYTLNAQCAAGSASINVRNVTAGNLGEAIVIGFAVIKAVTA